MIESAPNHTSLWQFPSESKGKSTTALTKPLLPESNFPRGILEVQITPSLHSSGSSQNVGREWESDAFKIGNNYISTWCGYARRGYPLRPFAPSFIYPSHIYSAPR